MKKKAVLPVAVLVIAALAAALVLSSRRTVERQPGVAPPPLVRVLAVEPADVPLVVRGNGSASPAIDTTLVAQVAGRVSATSPVFAEGAAFRRGAVLLEIEKRDYELAVAQAEASVAQAKVRVDRELAEAELAQREWQDLGLGDPVPLATREPQLAEARAALAAAEANLEMARLSLSRTTVRAPFDGQLRRKLVDLGQYVTPGAPLAEAFSTRHAEVAIPVPQQDLAFLDIDWSGTAAGPPVEFGATVAGAPHSWRGQVVRVSQEIDSQTRMATLYARIDDRMSSGPGKPLPLPMGTFLEAAIAGVTAEGVVTVPRSALRDGDRVLVVDGDSRLRFRPVEVLRLEGDEALIAGGLSAGEEICVSLIEAPVEGMQVRTTPATTESTEKEVRL